MDVGKSRVNPRWHSILRPKKPKPKLKVTNKQTPKHRGREASQTENTRCEWNSFRNRQKNAEALSCFTKALESRGLTGAGDLQTGRGHVLCCGPERNQGPNHLCFPLLEKQDPSALTDHGRMLGGSQNLCHACLGHLKVCESIFFGMIYICIQSKQEAP